ncbi:hypothetical protein [Paenibacillus hubeiensis]|uniref:hypothetical protein n=1 Tax=Paenibacillus hubeiensis TaxID=3077330 RepID=UPI0031BB4A6F
MNGSALSKIFASILAIILLFIYPLYQSMERQDDRSQMVVQKSVTRFVDAVRTKGYVTPTMYKQFNEEIAATGNVFDIEMVHEHKLYIPVYRDPADPSTFEGKYVTDYSNFYTNDIMKVMFPDSTEPDQSETRRYHLEVGDFFTVTIKNKNRTPATHLQDMLLAGSTGDNTKIFVPYGGMVINEDD